MTIETTTHFEDLSDEILISIFEFLPLEDSITIFGNFNTRFTCLIFDHPWTKHQLHIQTMNDEQLRQKIDFIDNRKLINTISSIHIQPFSQFHTIETFQQLKSIEHFANLKALSLQHITLEEVD